ncbi:MAG: hypothetical protein FH748_11315 [Balneolaceae bacterium]|nr:hypothetical protein [Balneolaceae bacterium]
MMRIFQVLVFTLMISTPALAQLQNVPKQQPIPELRFLTPSLEVQNNQSLQISYDSIFPKKNKGLLVVGWLTQDLRYKDPIDRFNTRFSHTMRAFDSRSVFEYKTLYQKNYLLLSK